MAFELTNNAYGKSGIRLTKVVRGGAVHQLFEFNVKVTLVGDFEASYTSGDNSKVIATDTIKNTVYVLAKRHAFDSPEAFARILAEHFPRTYPQVGCAGASVEQTMWRRIPIEGKPHDHSFVRDGTHRRTAFVEGFVEPAGGDFGLGGVSGLEVIKTTGSEWQGFHRDEYRTLKDAADRIFATTIDATWHYFGRPQEPDYNATYSRAVNAILAAFAKLHSLGAQHTIKAMGDAVLEACPEIYDVKFKLPNQHRIPFNLEPFGLKFENDIFVTTSEPYGEISGTVSRK